MVGAGGAIDRASPSSILAWQVLDTSLHGKSWTQPFTVHAGHWQVLPTKRDRSVLPSSGGTTFECQDAARLANRDLRASGGDVIVMYSSLVFQMAYMSVDSEIQLERGWTASCGGLRAHVLRYKQP